MAEFEKLIYIDLKVQNQKEYLSIVNGFKLYLFEALYAIQQFYGLHNFFDTLFIIFEFIQMMAFPMNKIFDESWGNTWVNTIGNFFRFFQLVDFFQDNFYFIIVYIITYVYLIVFLIFFFYVVINSLKYKSIIALKFLSFMLQIKIILNIPFLRTLFTIFSCNNDKLETFTEIECESPTHIALIAINIIYTVIFELLVILFHMTLYEFGQNSNKLKSAYSCSDDILLDLTKLLLIILYQFVKDPMPLAIATLFLSLILLVHFLKIKPYSNEFTKNLYLILYTAFFWTCSICIIASFLKNSKFKSSIVLVLLGYIFILFIIFFNGVEYSLDKLISFIFPTDISEYNSILKIEYFLKLEKGLNEKIRTRELKILYAYISEHLEKCFDKNCCLKTFNNIEFKVENFKLFRILLLQHAELLYKEAISKEPYNIKLRISYILFLINKINKIFAGKKELISLNKFEPNLENSFLIYKIQKNLNRNTIAIEENKDKEIDFAKSGSYKLRVNEIKILIEKIANNYIHFWNILLKSDLKKTENFLKMNQVGKEIKTLNNKLDRKIKSLEAWNLLDQDIIKMYVRFLNAVLNNYTKAKIYEKKISEDNENKHEYDDINLYQLNYEEMNKNENYKYIILSCEKNDVNTICNISNSALKLFGFTKKEVVGNSCKLLFPEIFNHYLTIFFKKKIGEFKNDLMNQNKKVNADIWVGDCYGMNKIKFLVPFKARWTIVSMEDEKMYLIANLSTENNLIMNTKKIKTVYILTDNDLKIQNFSPNAPEILNLNVNIEYNETSILEYINEFNEINENYFFENKKNSSDIKNSKILNTKQRRRFSKIDFCKNFFYTGKNIPKKEKIIHWKKKTDNKIIQEPKENNNNAKFYNSSINDARNSVSFGTAMRRASVGIMSFSMMNRSQLGNSPKNIFAKCKSEMDSNLGYHSENNNKDNLNKNNKNEKIFTLRIKEAKIDKYKVGYIFMLLPYTPEKEEKKIVNIQDTILNHLGENQIIYEFPEINFEKDEIYFQTILSEENDQFTFDLNNMSYKQFKCIENEEMPFYEDIKEKAIKKITDIKKQLQEEESEEEEESSEYEEENSSDEEDKSSKSKQLSIEKKEEDSPSKIDNNDKNIIEENKETPKPEENVNNKLKTFSSKKTLKKSPGNNAQQRNSINANKKKFEEDFYHVNANKVELYIFNYTSGFAEFQKDHKFKISQVTYVLNTEKEKMKNSNNRFINAKFIKGKKRGDAVKKEENEVNIFGNVSLKLKEIYSALASTKTENVIINLTIASIIIFVFVIGTGIMNTLIFLNIKSNIYNFFILIKNSQDLYQNILFEITLVKELVLINNPYYENPLNVSNKLFYYMAMSSAINSLYLRNAFIISNLTNHFNVLDPKDEESIIKKTVDLYIINPVSEIGIYQSKKYTILIYSAYRELNGALYHISKLNMNEMYYYQDDVYYFFKNGMSNLLISSEEQIWTLTEKFSDNIKEGHISIIICCAVAFAIYCLCSGIFLYFSKKVNIKKNKYISIFNELDSNLISSTLQKCEKFHQQLEEKKGEKEKTIKKKEDVLDSSSEIFSENNNDNESIRFLLNKNESNKATNISKGDRDFKNKNFYRFNIFQICLFLIIFILQLAIYIYYYLRISLYKNVITHEYYISQYASNFITIFIGLREYIFDKKTMFLNNPIDEYMEYNLAKYYEIFQNRSKLKDIYRVYFPDSYQVFLNYLYNEKICEFIDMYNRRNPQNKQLACNEFFYGTSRFNFFAIISAFVEEIRSLRDKIDNYYKIAEEKNFVYNETYFNSPKGYYQELYDKYQNNIGEYKKYNPANVFKTLSHKQVYITYSFINTEVFSFLISESLNQFEQIFSKYNNITLILNIMFIIVVVLGFIFLWLPFLFNQSTNFLNIKNLLSLVPSELLNNVPNINNLLGIGDHII